MVVVSVSIDRSLMKFEEITKLEVKTLRRVMNKFLDIIFKFLKQNRVLFFRSFILTEIHNVCNTNIVYLEFDIDLEDCVLSEKQISFIHFFIGEIREGNTHLSIAYYITTTGKKSFQIELFVHVNDYCFKEDISEENNEGF